MPAAIRSDGRAAPDRESRRAIAEVPERCMPTTTNAIFLRVLSAIAINQITNMPSPQRPVNEMAYQRLS